MYSNWCCLYGYRQISKLVFWVRPKWDENMKGKYFVLNSLAPAVTEVWKKSKFVASIFRADNATAAMAIVEVNKENSATHNCWAYRSEKDSRFNDDGEVTGTAGRQILTVLENEHLIRTLIIVSRYYGGINLGKGGLARAYSSAAKSIIDASQKVEFIDTLLLRVVANSGEQVGAVHRIIEQLNRQEPSFANQSKVITNNISPDNSILFDNRVGASAAQVTLCVSIPVGKLITRQPTSQSTGRPTSLYNEKFQHCGSLLHRPWSQQSSHLLLSNTRNTV